MRKFLLFLVCLIGLISLAVPQAHATQYFVSGTGNDSNTCLSGHACLTPNHVMSLVACGDTVNFLSTTFFLATSQNGAPWAINNLNCAGNPVTFQVSGGDGVCTPTAIANCPIILGLSKIQDNAWVNDAGDPNFPLCTGACTPYYHTLTASSTQYFEQAWWQDAAPGSPILRIFVPVNNNKNNTTPAGDANVCVQGSSVATANVNCGCPSGGINGNNCANLASPCTGTTFGPGGASTPYYCFNKFEYKNSDINCNWHDIALKDVQIMPFEIWTTERMKLSATNCGNGVAFLTQPTQTGANTGSAIIPIQGFLPGNNYLVQNAREQLSGGNFYLDRCPTTPNCTVPDSTWRVYYGVVSPDNPNTDTFWYPQQKVATPQVLTCNNSSGLIFKGLAIQGDNFTIPVDGLRDLAGQPQVSEAVTFNSCSNVTWEGMQVYHTTGWGMGIHGASSNWTIQDSVWYDNGGGGLKIGDQATSSDTNVSVPNNFTITNNGIGHTGRYDPTGESIGLWIGDAHDIKLKHNLIFGQYSGAVELGQGLNRDATGGTTAYFMQNLDFEFNDLYGEIGGTGNIISVLADFGGIHGAWNVSSLCPLTSTAPTGWPFPTNENEFCVKIKNNTIHDFASNPNDTGHHGGAGIYPDQGSGYGLIENNLVYRTGQDCVFQNIPGTQTGKFLPLYNVYRWNVFALCGEQQLGSLNPPRPRVINNGGNGQNAFSFYSNVVWYNTQVSSKLLSFPGKWGCYDYSQSIPGNFPIPCTNLWTFDKNIIWDIQKKPVATATCTPTNTACVCPQGNANCLGLTSNFNFYSGLPWGNNNVEDVNSLNADPLFVNPIYPTDNFTPTNQTALTAIGWVPADHSTDGRFANQIGNGQVGVFGIPNTPNGFPQTNVSAATDFVSGYTPTPAYVLQGQSAASGNFVIGPAITLVLVQVSNAGSNTIPVGGTASLVATANYAGGGMIDVTSTCLWSSSNPAVATVAGSGDPRTVTGVSVGTANFSCIQSGVVSNTQSVNVVQVNVTTTSLPSATVGSTYSTALAASGGTGPYTWTCTSGCTALSAIGLSFSTAGVLSGTPSSSANSPYAFTVIATDSLSISSAPTLLSLVVNGSNVPPLSITSGLAPNGTVSSSYGPFNPVAIGGVLPYGWSVLPVNLGSFATLTAPNGPGCTANGTPDAGCNNAAPSFATNAGNTNAQTQTPDPLPGNISTVPLTSYFPNFTGQYLYQFQPWFCNTGFPANCNGHINIGMDMSNSAEIHTQISNMIAQGTNNSKPPVALMDWYGLSAGQAFNKTVSDGFFSDANARCSNGFCPAQFGIELDEGALSADTISGVTCPKNGGGISQATRDANCTTVIEGEFDYIEANYCNVSNPVYVKHNNKCVATLFITNSDFTNPAPNFSGVIYPALIAHTNAYTVPFEIYNRAGTFPVAGGLTGLYLWIQPPTYTNASPNSQCEWDDITGGASCNFSTGVGTGSSYINNAFAGAISNNQPIIGMISKGFDWSNASWNGGVQKIVQQGCGQVLPLMAAKEIAALSTANMPFIQLVTVNDYEEGTQLETGVFNCVNSITASVAVNTLSWTLNKSDLTFFNTNTIDHYRVIYEDAGATTVKTVVDNLAPSSSSLVLTGLIPTGTWNVCVQMIGKTFIKNVTSNCVSYTASGGQTLPPGLSINGSTGSISGTPTFAGTFPFLLQVTDAVSSTSQQNNSITVAAAPPSLPSINSAPLPNGNLNASYSFMVTATGGTTPYTFSNIGSLPNGLTLNSSTGLVSGTPSATGTFAFTIKVTDANSNTATQPENVVINPAGGPPGYPLSSRSTSAPGNLTSPFNASTLVNSTAHDVVNPSVDCITRLTDQNTWGGQSVGNLTVSGGDNETMSSITGQYLGMTCCGGQTYIFHMNTTGACLQNVTNGTGIPKIAHGGSFSFSHVTENIYYQMTGSRILNQNTITSDSTVTTTNNSSFPFDFSTCPGVPAGDVGVNAVWNSNLTVADDDSIFSLSISWTGGQGTGILEFFYKPGTGCSTRNWQTGDIYTYCASNCQSATPAFNNTTCLTNTGTSVVGLHNTQATKDHVHMIGVSTGACTNIDPLVKGSTGFWEANTNNVQGCAAFPGPPGYSCSGHDSAGFDEYANQNNPNPNIRLLNPLTAGNVQTFTLLHVLPTFTGHVEFHAPWPLADNGTWIQGSSGTNGDGCIAGDSTGYLHPAYGCNAQLGLDPTNASTPLINFGLSLNSAQPTLSFGCQQTITYGTPDGKWLIYTSTMLNNLGFDNTGKPRCDVFGKKLE